MERRNPHYREAIETALGGRSVAGTATAHGLPRDAIRRVLGGHDPRLSRAEEICRVLGITFTIGAVRDSAHPAEHVEGSRVEDVASKSSRDRYANQARGTSPIRDPRLTEVSNRLADVWERLDTGERERLEVAIAALLDLTHPNKEPR